MKNISDLIPRAGRVRASVFAHMARSLVLLDSAELRGLWFWNAHVERCNRVTGNILVADPVSADADVSHHPRRHLGTNTARCGWVSFACRCLFVFTPLGSEFHILNQLR